jgi:hypothetical protein
MDVAAPQKSDAGEFIAAAQASRPLHQPWLDAPDTPARFAAYLDRAPVTIRPPSCSVTTSAELSSGT